MKERLRQRALELGFDDCRFTTAAPPASAPQFANWLAAGHHAEMAWLARHAAKRADPQLVLPGAKSLIMLAVNYGGAGEQMPDAGCQMPDAESPQHAIRTTQHAPLTTPPGLISRYARHADYHDVLAAPLRQLAAFVDALGGPGTRSLWYVDTGPLLERDFAQRAGLGFVGKHTNLISRTLGNWFLLAEILTSLELAPDAPARNHCGTCTRCLTACPTGALPAPFTLDARRCISYLTIELKGSIPVELRPLLGNRIFGCDDCLAACPWNRFAREAALMRSVRRPDLATPDLLDLLALGDAGFKTRFAGTPILRTKRRGLLRNVCVALGNTAGPDALPALARAATDTEPLIREHAVWAMEAIAGREVRPL